VGVWGEEIFTPIPATKGSFGRPKREKVACFFGAVEQKIVEANRACTPERGNKQSLGSFSEGRRNTKHHPTQAGKDDGQAGARAERDKRKKGEGGKHKNYINSWVERKKRIGRPPETRPHPRSQTCSLNTEKTGEKGAPAGGERTPEI